MNENYNEIINEDYGQFLKLDDYFTQPISAPRNTYTITSNYSIPIINNDDYLYLDYNKKIEKEPDESPQEENSSLVLVKQFYVYIAIFATSAWSIYFIFTL